MGILDTKDCIILDMDGTFYLGETILEGSLEFIRELERRGKQYLFFTNNSSKTAQAYVNKLRRMGCQVTEDQIATSGEVAAAYITQNFPEASVFLLGTSDLKEYMEQKGIRLTDTRPDIVLAAYDTSLVYHRLCDACRHIRGGSMFLATHPDFNCPSEDGFLPDCGSICACITASTGAVPKYLGKPYEETVKYLENCLNIPRDRMMLAGDRLYTEIAMGNAHGIASALVLTGETKREDLEASPHKPDVVVERLTDLLEV